MSHEGDGQGCCAPEESPPRENPPGRSQIAYRIGTHPTFHARMVEALARTGLADAPAARPLRALTTRALDDGTIALLDAWAVALDVLTFYQERIANEGYLGTAVERRSVLEIARAIGYELSPGVAASTRLAFTVDKNAPGGVVRIPLGLSVMSVPAQDQRPQTFETTEEIEARLEWNELRPTQRQPQRITASTQELHLRSTTTRLKKGDAIVLARPTGENATLRFVDEVDIRVADETSVVALDRPVGAAIDGPMVLTFRERASLFGHAAPNPQTIPRDRWTDLGGVTDIPPPEWNNFIPTAPSELDLDREYPNVIAGSWVCVQGDGRNPLFFVEEVGVVGRKGFTLAAKCTHLSFPEGSTVGDFNPRSTVVYAQSEELELAEVPLVDPVDHADRISLAGDISPLPGGREVLVVGEVAGAAPSLPIVEVAVVKVEATPSAGQLVFERPLKHSFARESLVIHGNVAAATHGATTGEILGSGDAARPHQEFVLKQADLTWVAANEASGAEATLELRVDGVLWERVDSLYGRGPNERVYVLRTDDDGRTHVQFGDGHSGARLPTGTGNVVGRYRKGIGLEGEVGPGQLTLLQQRPLGLQAVTNPAAAAGAGDPQALAGARRNAPLTVLTLDRLVSVQDYEDYAAAFAGVGKARAQELWDGHRHLVHLTVASASGAVFDPDADTLAALERAIAERGDPTHAVIVGPHQAARFLVHLKVLRDRAYTAEAVEAGVRAALADAFGFSARQFGQAVTATEVNTVVHGVPGVLAVDIDALIHTGEEPNFTARLPAFGARWNGRTAEGAELLLLSEEPRHLVIGWMET